MKRYSTIKTGRLLLAGLLLGSLGACEKTAQNSDHGSDWRPLFDGRTLDGWSGVNGAEIGSAWQVENGELVLTAGGAGDLVTREKFADFELQLEWKISAGGNSGIIYRVADGDGAVWMSGLEYQVLDNDGYPNLEKPSHTAGSVFDLYAPAAEVARPAGEYNSTRIRVEDGRVEHWLNGQKVVSFALDSEDWRQRLADSKFSDYAQFGRVGRGYIALQDHGDRVWYRNVKIREL